MRQRLRTLRVLGSLYFRVDPWRAVLTFLPILPIAAGVSLIAMRQMIDAVPADDTTRIVVTAVIFAGAWIVAAVVGRISEAWNLRLIETIIFELDRQILAATAALPRIEHFERPEYVDHLEVLRIQKGAIAFSSSAIRRFLDGAGGLIVSIVLLATIEPWLVVLPVAGIPSLVLNARAGRATTATRRSEAMRSRRALHLYDIATKSDTAKEIRVCRLHDELLDRYSNEWHETDHALFTAELREAALRAVGTTVAVVCFAGALIYLLDGVANGSVTPGDLFVALGLVTVVVNQLGAAVGNSTATRRALAVSEHLLWLREAAAEADATEQARSTAVPDALGRGIELDHVSFTYASSTRPALDDISLDIPAGTVLAVVGENGAGKTTLVKLLYGLYEPTAGTITVDGTDLADIRLEHWRARTSACFQDFVHAELLAREAVGVGDLPAITDHDVIIRAMERAAATDLVEQLPEGLDTTLGATLGGIELSGGQWQKTAIARAMMRPRPLLLALDEPTSSLDPLAELELFERYADAARTLAKETGTITVLVSHRFSTVRIADLIIVMDDGHIAEHGTHDELMAHNGPYRELYELQARHYK